VLPHGSAPVLTVVDHQISFKGISKIPMSSIPAVCWKEGSQLYEAVNEEKR